MRTILVAVVALLGVVRTTQGQMTLCSRIDVKTCDDYEDVSWMCTLQFCTGPFTCGKYETEMPNPNAIAEGLYVPPSGNGNIFFTSEDVLCLRRRPCGTGMCAEPVEGIFLCPASTQNYADYKWYKDYTAVGNPCTVDGGGGGGA